MQILSKDGQTNGMRPITFSKYKMGKKGLLKINFTINRAQTLFGPDWSQLKVGACPHCGNKLHQMRKNPDLMYCKSKSHAKSFVIHSSKINELLSKV